MKAREIPVVRDVDVLAAGRLRWLGSEQFSIWQCHLKMWNTEKRQDRCCSLARQKKDENNYEIDKLKKTRSSDSRMEFYPHRTPDHDSYHRDPRRNVWLLKDVIQEHRFGERGFFGTQRICNFPVTDTPLFVADASIFDDWYSCRCIGAKYGVPSQNFQKIRNIIKVFSWHSEKAYYIRNR